MPMEWTRIAEDALLALWLITLPFLMADARRMDALAQRAIARSYRSARGREEGAPGGDPDAGSRA